MGRVRISKAHKESMALEAHFMDTHNNPPAPFNPLASKAACDKWRAAVDATHAEPEDEFRTREQRAARIQELYNR